MPCAADEEDEEGECVREPPNRRCHCHAAQREMPRDEIDRKGKLGRDIPNGRCLVKWIQRGLRLHELNSKVPGLFRIF